MPTLRKLVTTGSAAVLLLFGIYVVSASLLREPPTPQVHVTIEPQPLDETTGPLEETTREVDETTDATTSEPGTTTDETTDEPPTGAYRTGERTGEELSHLWKQSKDFGKGLWSSLTEKEN